jgi:hypothetical protein
VGAAPYGLCRQRRFAARCLLVRARARGAEAANAIVLTFESDYSQLQFFPKLAAFNIGWRERPRRRIDSFIAPRGCLTRPGMANQAGDHSHHYPGFPA